MNPPSAPSDRLAFGAFRLTAALVGALPLPVAVNLGSVVGALAHALAPIRRRVVRRNLRLAFGSTHTPNEIRRIERATYRHVGMLGAECIGLWRRQPEWLERQIVEWEGEEHAHPFLNEGEPCLVVTGHFGNWEMLGAFFGRRLGLSVVAKPLHNASMDRHLSAMRGHYGLEMISSTEGSVAREILKAARRRRNVCFLADQDARRAGIFVPFFGHPASTFTGPALMALRLRLPLVPAFLLRLSPGRHRVVIRPPIRVPSGMPTAQAVEWLTREHVRILEDMIRLAPSQYFWFHRRWKTAPREQVES